MNDTEVQLALFTPKIRVCLLCQLLVLVSYVEWWNGQIEILEVWFI
jgi:hypothetical protein